MKTLDYAVSEALSKLDDSACTVWSRDTIKRYTKEGYEQLTRRSKCVFDVEVVENLPPIGNYSAQMEAYLAQQAGLAVTGQFNFTAEFERDLAPPGAVGPVKATAPSDIQWFDELDIPTTSGPARLPKSTVDVIRVFHDYQLISPDHAQNLRRLDRNFQTREGVSDLWSMDSDGLFTFRPIPKPDGAASYDEVDGQWGTVREEDSFEGTVSGSWGILREDTEAFPAGGPWGIPRRLHPDALNTVVEVSRLGRDLDSYGFEIPDSYVKYVIYWAMYKALRMDGPGQDIKLSDHFRERFELGISRMASRLRVVNSEHYGMFGSPVSGPGFGIGSPQTPSVSNFNMESPY